jgi:site-specific DNA-methyltransferase (adenine-specific)
MTDLATNLLYYGDNLDILRRYLPETCVDLVYLDPPFNSNRDYNVIFRDESGNATDDQLLAFEDTLVAALSPQRHRPWARLMLSLGAGRQRK